MKNKQPCDICGKMCNGGWDIYNDKTLIIPIHSKCHARFQLWLYKKFKDELDKEVQLRKAFIQPINPKPPIFDD